MNADLRTRAAEFLRNERVRGAVHLATLRKVEQRAAGMRQLHDSEGLRELAARIKQHTLEHLPRYLAQFIAQARQSGAELHFAPDAQAARDIVCQIAAARGLTRAVKAKSMTSEEIHLNDALQSAGVQTVETDLGEFIVQIDDDRPSHIVTPIIHKDRAQVAAALRRKLGCACGDEPTELTQIARRHLRQVFREADLGISGVNFAVAESGTLCICTNEGNGRMTSTRPRVHIAIMGIEKLLPRLCDLAVFLKLLARSSTGQPLTVYTSLISGPRRPRDCDGPRELHIVLLDAGRTQVLAGVAPEVLRCIRCGACLNACPVYRNVGGHAYGSVYPGPIGALITPLLQGLERQAELPRASSLCGACHQACPVKIDIPAALVKLREQSRQTQPLGKRVAMWAFEWIMQSPAIFELAQRALRRFGRGAGWISRGPGPLAGWTQARDLPIPAYSFRQIWNERLKDGE